LKKEGIGVIYLYTNKLNNLKTMPKVGEKEFEYDEEGVAAAEAEAANTGQAVENAEVGGGEGPIGGFLAAIDASLAEAEKPSAEPVEGEAPQEEPVASTEDVTARLFNEVFGEDFNPEDEIHLEQMEAIQDILQSDPELARRVSLPQDHPDSLSDSEFATIMFRGFEQEEQGVV